MVVRSIVTLCSPLVLVPVPVVVLVAVLVEVAPVVMLVPFTPLMLKSDATTLSGTGLQAVMNAKPIESNAKSRRRDKYMKCLSKNHCNQLVFIVTIGLVKARYLIKYALSLS